MVKTEASLKIRSERKVLQAEYNNVRNSYLILIDNLKNNRAEKLEIRNKIKKLTQEMKRLEA